MIRKQLRRDPLVGSVPLAVGNLLGSATINNAIIAAMHGILVTGALTVMIAKPRTCGGFRSKTSRTASISRMLLLNTRVVHATTPRP